MHDAAWWMIACAVLGLLTGVPVRAVIWRLAAADPPRTACPTCGGRARRTVACTAALTGRCADCGQRSGPPRLVPEVLTGAAFALCAWIAHAEGGSEAARVLRAAGLCWLAAFALAAVWVDAIVQRLPDRLVLPAGAGTILLSCGAAFVDHRPAVAGRVLLAAALAATVFLLLAVFAGVGFGDVKLAGALGAALGYASFTALWRGAVLTFLFAGCFTALRLVSGRARRGDRLALGPFLYAGCMLALCLH